MTSDLGGARRGSLAADGPGGWWDWSETKVGIEWLLDIGEVVCVRRVGWRRVYDLVERAVPADLLAVGTDIDGVIGPTDVECVRDLLRRSGRVTGVATIVDLTDVHRLGTRHVARDVLLGALRDLVDAGEFVEVEVPGWRGPTYAWADALRPAAAGRHRTTLLSPFDSLVWHRGRTSRVFGFDHSLEAYVPAAKRVHGYFTMPVLHGGRLVARVDPKRSGSTLHARQVGFEVGRSGVTAAAVEGTARALREATRWVGCDRVEVGAVSPESARARLSALLQAAPTQADTS